MRSHWAGGVAQALTQLEDRAGDGGHGVGEEVVTQVRVEPVDRLEQAEVGDLNQILQRLTGLHVAPSNVPSYRQVAGDYLLPKLDPAWVRLGRALCGQQRLHVAVAILVGGRSALTDRHREVSIGDLGLVCSRPAGRSAGRIPSGARCLRSCPDADPGAFT